MGKQEFDFKEMGRNHARNLLMDAMRGTPKQIENQVEFVKWIGIETLSSVVFNMAFDGEELDATKKMSLCNEISEHIMDGVQEMYAEFKKGNVKLREAEKGDAHA